MLPLSVDASLLRAVLTADVQLAVGRELMVRVASLDAGGHGTLSLAGTLLEAELPAGVNAGDELRLQVREVTPERIVLAIQDDGQQPVPQAAPAEAPVVRAPEHRDLRSADHNAGGKQATGDGTHTIDLRYDAPALGPVEMRFTLTRGALGVTMSVTPSAHAEVDARTAELAQTLTDVSERPTRVTVIARRDPLEVFA
jgi:hypothetical protein